MVSGGTGALGLAVVRTLLDAGARVAVPWRTASSFDGLRRATGSPSALWGAPSDVSDPARAADFFAAAVPWLGGLDGVAVLSGAYAGGGTLQEAPAGEWDGMLRANLSTAYAVCRAALLHLPPGSSVVTVGSRLAHQGGAGSAAYAVSKAAVAALTRVLAEENRARGVRFNCVVPGTIDTAANRSAMPGADPTRWTTPVAIARVILFLLSPSSAPVTGALLPVDAPVHGPSTGSSKP